MGCGFGDFLAYLNERGIDPRYTGLDICQPMIERCNERFDAGDARFIVGDVLDYAPEEPFDYVVASGIFGYAAKGTRERAAPDASSTCSASRASALAVNFLSGCRTTPQPRAGSMWIPGMCCSSRSA